MIKKTISIAILLIVLAIAIAIAIGWTKRNATLAQLQVNVSSNLQQPDQAAPSSLLASSKLTNGLRTLVTHKLLPGVLDNSVQLLQQLAALPVDLTSVLPQRNLQFLSLNA